MKWSRPLNNEEIGNLPLGTILVVEACGQRYIKVVGDGAITTGYYDDDSLIFGEAKWDGVECEYEIVLFATPPEEYNEFLQKAMENEDE